MSLSNKVNVFLERARQFSGTSPIKTTYSQKRIPTKTQQEKTLPNNMQSKSSSKFQSKSDLSQQNLVVDLEDLINDFLKSRCDANKKLHTHKQKELKIISDIKQTLDIELEKSKSQDISSFEKLCQEKTEKVLLIVKEEAKAMDKKLLKLTHENTKLKQILSEKNIEIVDKKLWDERTNIKTILTKLSTSKSISKKSLSKLSELLRATNPNQVAKVIEKILNNNENEILCMLSLEILEKTEEFEKDLQLLKESIQVKREYSFSLSEKIRDLEMQCGILPIIHRGSIKDFPKPKEIIIPDEYSLDSLKDPINPSFGSKPEENYNFFSAPFGQGGRVESSIEFKQDSYSIFSGNNQSQEMLKKPSVLTDDDELFMIDKYASMSPSEENSLRHAISAHEVLENIYGEILTEFE
ncbi:hypothetical protein SteCoe_17490 [Stentor coeruleus]|uniref:Uncharacterized protein n=1 Tax=Stentor coeruleus TaxID=5963 RepID=A0A1R2BYT7_9CILI|nr:hypothetical protein SteCoe_17490 [Stentor coeruleus]